MKQSAMNNCLRILLTLLLSLSLFTVTVHAATTPTEIWIEPSRNFSNASDVAYVTNGDLVANWGIRGEHATFLTDYAVDYYTGACSYENLLAYKGSANIKDTPSSPLYNALSDMMNAKASSTTTYAETRDLFKYTDCMANDYSHISSFYSGIKLNGKWDGAQTWNREHTWPNSKIDGRQETDIMMLRPSCVRENSDRGNSAYGESLGYYDPNSASNGQFNLHGDCARIVLYTYVRWGVTDTMWGSKGVIENLDVLLRWMEEDPVDTWEMGRNDAVQSITGVRNVFVDYPELSWLLFDREIPTGYSSPSGVGENGSCRRDSSDRDKIGWLSQGKIACAISQDVA